jgi:methylmalonyl-CoA mutase
VVDPGAGSGFIEALTDQIARAAWDRLQVIEGQGGVVAALESGLIAREIAAAVVARGEPKILGVTVFAPTSTEPVEVEPAAPAAIDPETARLPGPDSRCPPLNPVRLSEPFEART